MTNKIAKRSTIRFPEPISLEETEKLIGYVCENLPGRANYHAGYHMSTGKSLTERDQFYSQRGTVDLAGMISRHDGTAFDGFNCAISREGDTSKFEALVFQTTPGYDSESEYGEGTLELWDDVRNFVQKYFGDKAEALGKEKLRRSNPEKEGKK